MKIFFIGTVEFSHSALEKLMNLGAEIVGVASKKQSNFNSDFANLAPICESHSIPIFYPDDINSNESINAIRALTPDVIYCFGWSSLIKEELLNLAPMGVIGFHPAKLPMNRGRHPIVWALALGLEETASTFFFMDKGADSGPIVSQERITISYTDDARSLYDKITKTALTQIENFTQRLSNNNIVKTEQNHKNANYWRKRGKQDGCIDFRMSSRAVYNLVRALTKPYVGAHVIFNEAEVKVWKVEEISSNACNFEPGKVLESSGNEFVVKTYDGAIKIIEHEFSIVPSAGMYL
jgi:methionyl-tRNA formyltransferase